MSRKSIMGEGSDLEALVEDVVYKPTEESRRLKSRFLARIADNPVVDVKEMTLAEAQRILNTSLLSKYWNQPGFREWFLNTSEYQERMEELFSLALDAARDILVSQDPKAQGARASMIKTMAELAGKMRPKAGKEDANAAAAAAKLIGQMDMAQLSMLLEKNGNTLQIEASKGVLPEKKVDNSFDV